MRLSLFCSIGLVLMLAGCCSHESASSETSASSTEAECKPGECCSSVSRASLLKKSSGKEETKASDESK